jgi:hypothetical protein
MKRKSYLDELKEAVGQSVTLDFAENSDGGTHFWLDNSVSSTVAEWHMVQLPGCCGVMVCYNSYVSMSWQGRGIGGIVARLKKKLAYDMGYTLLLATDILENEPNMKIFEKASLKMVASFENRRTDNQVGVFAVELIGDPTPYGDVKFTTEFEKICDSL